MGIKKISYYIKHVLFQYPSQEPFNKITYSLIGDDSAPSFFSLAANGEIKLRSGVNLPADTETTYTVSSRCIMSHVHAYRKRVTRVTLLCAVQLGNVCGIIEPPIEHGHCSNTNAKLLFSRCVIYSYLYNAVIYLKAY